MNLTTLEQSKLLKEWGAPQDFPLDTFWLIGDNRISPASEDKVSFDYKSVHDTKFWHDEYAAYDLESLYELVKDQCSGLSWRGDHWVALRPGWEISDTFVHRGDTALNALFDLWKTVNEK